MPQLGQNFGISTDPPETGIYDVGEIGRVEIKDEGLEVEGIIIDIPALSPPLPPPSAPVDPRFDNTPISLETAGTTFVTQTPQTQILQGSSTTVRNTLPSTSITSSSGLIPSVPPSLPNPRLPPVSPGNFNPPPPPPCTIDPVDQPETTGPEVPEVVPPEEGPSTSTPTVPKGKHFYEPQDCETCCHSPTDSPSQFYTYCLLVATDPLVTKMIEGGYIDQVYQSMPVFQAKYESGLPGAYLQETSFLDFTNQQKNALVNSVLFTTPKKMLTLEPEVRFRGIPTAQPVFREEINAYQFQRKFNFKIPPNPQHLALFVFIRFDQILFNEYYNLSTRSIPQGVYTGPVKELVVIKDSNLSTTVTTPTVVGGATAATSPSYTVGSFGTGTPNPPILFGRRPPIKTISTTVPLASVRSSKVFNLILKYCSTSILEALQAQKGIQSSKQQSSFWLSRRPDSNLVFFMFNLEQMMMQNSFIPNMKSKEVYTDQELQTLDVFKIDSLNDNEEELINSTSGVKTQKGSAIKSVRYSKTKTLEDPESVGEDGKNVVLSEIVELPSPARGVKLLQILDSSKTSGDFAYRVSFSFRDASISFITSETNDYVARVNNLVDMMETIKASKQLIKDGEIPVDELYAKYLVVAKAAIAKAMRILGILPNNDYNSTIFMNYVTSLANPNATLEDHEDFYKILKTLQETLISIVTAAGGRVSLLDDIGPSPTNKRSARNKNKGIINVESTSQKFRRSETTGIDFLSIETGQEATQSGKIVYDASYLQQRAEAEFNKFWNSGQANQLATQENNIRDNCKFFLTPNRVYGTEETINLLTTGDFTDTFREIVKKVKPAKKGKATKSGYFSMILDSLEDIPASLQVVESGFDFMNSDIEVDNTYDLADRYLQMQDNFKSNDVNTFENKSNQVSRFDSKIDRVMAEYESTIIEGFQNISKSSIQSSVTTLTTLEDTVDGTPISNLPPALAAYSYRNKSVSKFSTFISNYGLLSDASNKVYLDNFFGVVARVQYASMKPSNLNSIEWKNLDTEALSRNGFLFCRILPLKDVNLRLDCDLENTEIYNEYFALQLSPLRSKARENSNSVKPQRMLAVDNTESMQRAIDQRIQMIMSQKTTYSTGTPIVYSNVIR